MNKTIFAGILLCIVSFILSGCNGNTYGITSGTYEMVDSEENVFTPYLTLDLEDKTFTFTFDVLSSYGNLGSIKFNKGNLICKQMIIRTHLFSKLRAIIHLNLMPLNPVAQLL